MSYPIRLRDYGVDPIFTRINVHGFPGHAMPEAAPRANLQAMHATSRMLLASWKGNEIR